MRTSWRSIAPTLALGLLTFTLGPTPPAQALDPAADTATADGQAPTCVEFFPSWRYTFVANHCTDQQNLTVLYRDHTDVGCRLVAPGDTATFPGYGVQGNEVVGIALCAGPDTAR
ncbi:alpha-amylase [Streptomyces sp. H39-S7]|uniref:alpha-amylase n=1 Tax=Streptomyces sp. H39-S7 TaxID=3004357 RepID=UPI0022AFE8CA|nr:alpha-amylase [Streptomyces sp. H39-S7]MCZ4124683.1 alpha-amylase [Streptomyces sp. H39-S7]